MSSIVFSEWIAPISWDSNGMDWESPDIMDYNYLYAILQAIAERRGGALGANSDAIDWIKQSPYHGPSFRMLAWIVDRIREMVPSFLDISELPSQHNGYAWRFLDFNQIVSEPGFEINIIPWALFDPGALNEWLKKVKRVLGLCKYKPFKDVFLGDMYQWKSEVDSDDWMAPWGDIEKNALRTGPLPQFPPCPWDSSLVPPNGLSAIIYAGADGSGQWDQKYQVGDSSGNYVVSMREKVHLQNRSHISCVVHVCFLYFNASNIVLGNSRAVVSDSFDVVPENENELTFVIEPGESAELYNNKEFVLPSNGLPLSSASWSASGDGFWFAFWQYYCWIMPYADYSVGYMFP